MSEWGPWLIHDGGDCPCVGYYVRVEGLDARGGYQADDMIASNVPSWNWKNYGLRNTSGQLISKIIRYRIRKPKGLTILQSILREVEHTRTPEYTAG